MAPLGGEGMEVPKKGGGASVFPEPLGDTIVAGGLMLALTQQVQAHRGMALVPTTPPSKQELSPPEAGVSALIVSGGDLTD